VSLIAVTLAVVLLIISAPIFLAFGAGSIFYGIYELSLPAPTLMQVAIHAISKHVLLAIPLFIFSGLLMVKGGAARRLVDLSISMVGHLPGGMGIAMIITMAFFAAFSGSVLAAIAAVGLVFIPRMVEQGYSKGFVAVLAATAALLQSMIPPSNAAIIYSSLTHIPTADTFAAGIGPAMLLIAMLTVYLVWHGRNMPLPAKASRQEVKYNFIQAFPALLTPVFILGGIYSGLLAPSESAAIAALWALITGFFIYKELNFKELRDALQKTASISCTVFIIIATASLFSFLLAYNQTPQDIITYFTEHRVGGISFLLLAGFSVLLLGTFLEAVPIFYITIPIFAPLCKAIGIDLLHFYSFFALLVGLGLITPPLCVGVYSAASIAGESPHRALKYIPPFFFIGVIAAVIILFWPSLSTWLPSVLAVN
jgi:C4-dicarboxylate transporter DctM subunit